MATLQADVVPAREPTLAPVPTVSRSPSPPGSSPFEGAAVQPISVTALTPHSSVPASSSPAAARQQRRGLAALLTCSCFGGGAGTGVTDGSSSGPSSPIHSPLPSTPTGALQHRITGRPSGSPRKMSRRSTSPRKQHGSGPVGQLKHMGSSAYSDAEWYDASSTFSGAADQAAMLEEVQQMVKELAPFKPAPWIPDPPLVFGTPGTQFVRVPPVTGFAAYWLRDDERTTPFPQPIDVMLKAPYLVQKTHASIPGIWIQETDTELSITATPSYLPPFLGISGYAEQYDKSNATEPSWMPRRDLKMGKAYGKLYFTADGMMIARVWQKPVFSDKVDIIMEEYMRLEENGEVIVDRMTCLHVESGKRASQYLVGFRRDAPPK